MVVVLWCGFGQDQERDEEGVEEYECVLGHDSWRYLAFYITTRTINGASTVQESKSDMILLPCRKMCHYEKGLVVVKHVPCKRC
jgi:hypothetical protein